MKLFRIFPAVAALLSIVISIPLTAHATNNLPTSGAMPDVVYLRKNCETLQNCATTLAELTTWLAATRKPNEESPLLVNMGPGTFDKLEMTCNSASNYLGYVSFMGAGRQQTIIAGFGPGVFAMGIGNCTQLSFSNLMILAANDGTDDAGGGISWNGGGVSTWSNVDVVAQYWGWEEHTNTCGSTQGTHSWFGSRISVTEAFGTAVAVKATCDASWFYGSEISTTVNSAGAATAMHIIGSSAEAHVYGSVIRAISHVNNIKGVVAVSAATGGVVHIHGTGIDVSSTAPNNLIALNAATGGMIHANESSYNLSTISGTVTRIKKDTNASTHVHAPYLWEHIPDPVTIPNFTSVTGADVTTEVAINGVDINMLVYNSQCAGAGGPWYNVALRSCR